MYTLPDGTVKHKYGNVYYHPAFSLGCFRGVLQPPIVQIYPLSVFQRLLHPHQSHDMQSRFVFNNYYQTVIHMQVHSNQLHNSDTRRG